MTAHLPKDEGEHPVPVSWRGMLRAVVTAWVEGDYELARGIEGVDAPDSATVEQVRSYVADYGEDLVPLDETGWARSIAQWEGGDTWAVLIDLWTAGEGRSDMVLSGNVTETADGPRLRIYMVYVP